MEKKIADKTQNPATVIFFDSFPKKSERFLHREVEGIIMRGCNIKIAALTRVWDERLPVPLRGVYGNLIAPIDFFWVLFNPAFWGCIQVVYDVFGFKGLFFMLKRMGAFGRFKRKLIPGEKIHSAHGGWCGVAAWVTSKIIGSEFSFSCHARDVFVQQRILFFLSKRATKVITCNSAAKARLLELGIPEDKLHLIHHPIPMLEARTETDIVPHLLAAAGRAVEKKGFDILLNAVSQVRERFEDVKLVLLGPSREELGSNIPEWVEAKGFLNPVEFRAELSRAQVFVNSSRVAGDGDRDGIPNVILESLSLGIPVISTSAGSCADVIINERTGLLIPSQDSESIAQAVCRMLEDNEFASRLAKKGRELVMKEFNPEKTIPLLCDVLGLARNEKSLGAVKEN